MPKIFSHRRLDGAGKAIGCLFALTVMALEAAQAADEDALFLSNEYFTFGSPSDRTAAIKLADFDGDGDLDAIAANGRHWARPDLIFENNGIGRFPVARQLGSEWATAYEPAVADINQDGKPDIVTARDRTQSRLYLNQGSVGFVDAGAIGLSGPARSVSAADFDGNGGVDLLFTQRSAQNYVLYQDAGIFERILLFGPAEETVRAAIADFDGDGDLDAVFANLGPEGSYIALNDGAGDLSRMMRLDRRFTGAVDVAAGDMNGDGSVDLVFAGIAQNVVFVNDGRGIFDHSMTFGPADERSYGVAVADLDNDGDLDIAIANDGEENAVYLNDGADFRRIALTEDPGARSYGVTVGDLNGDGFVDLVFANSGAMNRTYLNGLGEAAAQLIR